MLILWRPGLGSLREKWTTKVCLGGCIITSDDAGRDGLSSDRKGVPMESIKAYRGKEKYVFISYAHRDRSMVLSELELLQKLGCRFWYDEGIEAGEDWAARIGNSLSGSSAVLLFASDYALKRDNVLREIRYALDNRLPILVVKTGSKPFPEELKKELFTNQIVDINSVSTYGELTDRLLPALKGYGVMEETEGMSPEAQALASQKIRIPEQLKLQKKVITAAGIVLGLLLAAVLFRFLLFRFVPDVVGMPAGEAQDLVAGSGMNSQVSLDYSPDFEYGVIFKQSVGGNVFRFIPVVLTQSLGPNENLTTVPEVTGNHIADGAIALSACGMTRFTIHPEAESDQQPEYISAQSIPPGLRVSKDSRIRLDVRSDGGDIRFYYNGSLVTVSGTEDSELDLSLIEEKTEEPEPQEEETESETVVFGLNDPDSFGMTEAEWQLFYENSHHTTDEDEKWETLWLPAVTEEMMLAHPDSSYGWVAVRDMELNAERLFEGCRELYVCPGVTVTVRGKSIEAEGLHDFYVAEGGTLVFDQGLLDYARICNDGRTVMNGDFNTASVPSTVYNCGSFETAGRYLGDITFFNFGEGNCTGEDGTDEGIYDFGLYGAEFYEGVTGSKGMVGLTDGFKTYDALLKDATANSYAGEDPRYDNVGNYRALSGSSYYPVFTAEQLSAHAAEANFCFGFIILNDMECREDWYPGAVRYGFVEIIVAPGATLIYPEELTDHRYCLSIYEGAKFTVNGNLTGRPATAESDVEITNAGTLEVNGKIDGSYNYWGTSFVMNMGSITGNGIITGSNMDIFTFKDSTSTIDLSTCRSVNHIDYSPNFYIIDNGPRSRWEIIHECYDKHKDDEDKTAYIQEALRRGLIR